MREPRGRLKPVLDLAHQGASLSKPRSYPRERGDEVLSVCHFHLLFPMNTTSVGCRFIARYLR